jgi:hypothetical protein
MNEMTEKDLRQIAISTYAESERFRKLIDHYGLSIDVIGVDVVTHFETRVQGEDVAEEAPGIVRRFRPWAAITLWYSLADQAVVQYTVDMLHPSIHIVTERRCKMGTKQEQLKELELGLYHVNQQLAEVLATLELLDYDADNISKKDLQTSDQLDYVLRCAKRNLSRALDDNRGQVQDRRVDNGDGMSRGNSEMEEVDRELERTFSDLPREEQGASTAKELLDQYAKRRMNVKLEQPLNKLKAAVMLMASAQTYAAEGGDHIYEEEGYYAIETMVFDAIEEICAATGKPSR